MDRLWSFKVYGRDTSHLVGIRLRVDKYIPFFRVTNPWVSEGDDAYYGECDRSMVSVPGPEWVFTPCLPDNMRYHKHNRYFTYEVGLRKLPKRSALSERPRRPN